ncbi:MAG TPA: glycosyltransferase family 4 protein [Acidobacteriota bacterium]|nr:glycosyltransferase family 4 protein [Acidobacteriota bacterium]
MRIACITAGAGRMYCGSCLRDNTLASALLDAGHDVLLIPTYTPTRTDDVNVSMQRVFLGGINIYLQQRFGFFRTSPHILDRLWDFKPLLTLVTRLGMSVNPADLGHLTVSMLRGTKGVLKKEIVKLVRFLQELSPEVVNLPNSMLIALAPAIKAEMKVPVCCTLQGEDLFLESLREPFRKESIQLIREHADSVDAFIAVSDFGARSMAGYLGIDRARIHVVPLGMNYAGFEKGTAPDTEPFTIGYMARISPEKGLHFLCDAYRILRSRAEIPPSRLFSAGYLAPEQRPYLSGIRQNLESWGLTGQFHYHGELDRAEKLNFLKALSVFSVPGVYDDPKGLFLLEAMACGIPVVQPRRGAFTEIIENTGGGILVEPDKPEALAEGLLELWRNPERRIRLGELGSQAVRERFTSSRMAEAALAIYRSVL